MRIDGPKFIGNALCLDFVNTVEWRGAPERAELLADYDELLIWAEAAGVLGRDARGQRRQRMRRRERGGRSTRSTRSSSRSRRIPGTSRISAMRLGARRWSKATHA